MFGIFNKKYTVFTVGDPKDTNLSDNIKFKHRVDAYTYARKKNKAPNQRNVKKRVLRVVQLQVGLLTRLLAYGGYEDV